MASEAMKMTKKMMSQQYQLQGIYGGDGAFDPLKMRVVSDASMEQLPPEQGVTFISEKLGTMDAECCMPMVQKPEAVMMYIHGGGMVAGNAKTSRFYASVLANATGYPVYSCSYGLAPENPFPAAVNDCVSGYQALVEKYPEKALIVLGESGGAYLTLTTTLKAKELNLKMPAAVVAYSVLADMSGTLDRSAKKDTDTSLTEEALAYIGELYCPDESMRKNPCVSLIFGDYTDFPPLLLVWDESELLSVDSKKIAELTEQAGVQVLAKGYPECFHAFPTLGHILPESEEVLQDTIRFIQDNL